MDMDKQSVSITEFRSKLSSLESRIKEVEAENAKLTTILSNCSCHNKNSMEGVLVSKSPVNQPGSESVPSLPFTKEAIMSVNNYSVTFEHARSLFGVDLPTFKAKLLEFGIFVWKAPHGLRIRIHGGAYMIPIAIDKLCSHHVVMGTLSFSDVVNNIERSLGLPPGGYELTYKHPQTLAYNLLKTDRDWHYAVEYSKGRENTYSVRLDVKTDAPNIVAQIAAYEEYGYDYEDEDA